MKTIEFNIPAIRGFQGEQPFYTALCPIRLLPKLFPIHAEESADDARQSFRSVNQSRVREITKNIVEHRADYQLAAVTISIEHEVRFVSTEKRRSKAPLAGQLLIPLESRFTILDGIHRICALQQALTEAPSLADDSIGMLLHIDADGSRRRQLFSEVKRHERTTAPSRRIAFDEHDELARLTRDVIAVVPAFGTAIEMDKTAISNRSRKLFTLSALYQANRELLADRKADKYASRVQLATEFWTAVAKQIPGWSEVVQSDTSAAEIRAGYVHCHAIGLAAIARAGRALLAQSPMKWKKQLTKLATLDWSRSNTQLWEGRAMIGGRLSKSSSAVARAGSVVKQHLGLKISPNEPGET